MELAIHTSPDFCSIGLSRQGELMAEMTWHSGQNHTVELVPNIISLLNQVKGSPQSLTVIFVAKGPGSYNGLRVGVGTAKGLAFSLDIPLVGISTLEVEAYQHAGYGLPICAVLNAGRGEIAIAMYQKKANIWRQLVEEQITTVESL